MFTRLLKFRIPTGTVFEIAENGWLLGESNATQCGDAGCYAVLARNDDGAGQTTWVVQVWPQAYRRFGKDLKYIITNVSLNSTFTGAQLASKPETLLVSSALGTVPAQPLPSAIVNSREWAAENGYSQLAFRTIGENSAADAAAYYQAVDPSGSRTTLQAWKQVNGFGPDDTQDEAKAWYFNAGDLVLGRSMHLKSSGNDIAYYVSNYPTVNDAIRGTNLIATVAMEYSPIQPGGNPVMKYFVFGGNNARVDAADLDGQGAKFIPNLCSVCHGNRPYTAGGNIDVNARFLPFDLQSYQYSTLAGRNGQEAAFKKLNERILDHPGTRSVATAELIQKWYEDPAQPGVALARATQNDDAVPSGWTANQPLYLSVIRPGCRSCHVSRDAPKGFGAFTDFTSFAVGNNSQLRRALCSERTMPNALVNHERFWLSAGGSMIAVLNASAVPGFAPAIACPP
jgi:mono/diheme cytochrome c family protein